MLYFFCVINICSQFLCGIVFFLFFFSLLCGPNSYCEKQCEDLKKKMKRKEGRKEGRKNAKLGRVLTSLVLCFLLIIPILFFFFFSFPPFSFFCVFFFLTHHSLLSPLSLQLPLPPFSATCCSRIITACGPYRMDQSTPLFCLPRCLKTVVRVLSAAG
eukprot:TRINITY_DN5384_c1_g1_i1.p1 TRINITY_DN5384_c1_g1~~TRINITY_DN5384_c1_g1_i1.p1  ORF type:complete len:158 (+),score=0.89 TRINITY_DN5384_c1_g1_i1:319-792(+)